MPRTKKSIELKPIDDQPVESERKVVRLLSPDAPAAPKPVRPAAPPEEPKVSERLTVPQREDIETRSHEPSIDTLIEATTGDQDQLEAQWGEATDAKHPVPWGWFVLFGLAIASAAIWSIAKLEDAGEQAEIIRTETVTALIDDEREIQEAKALINRLESTLNRFFSTTEPRQMLPMIRHSKRVAPLIASHYAAEPYHKNPLKSILSLEPLTLGKRADFWLAKVRLEDGNVFDVIVETYEDGPPRIDWETYVVYQPVPWDDFFRRETGPGPFDFRVQISPDNLYSHEFADSDQWMCYQLNALGSEEPLYGYARAGSPQAVQLSQLINQNGGRVFSLILRVKRPKDLKSHRGVIIEKVLAPRWIYIDPPATET